ncbi:MAG: FAD-dependent monooxygenase [Hamadaea sp.]|uniref:FAD-dependent oxidoreductase n=1 Tax=Hamadaea sp. TaxID=2024425 RepID=UPI00179A2771|nr:NAD(P)/FAD-dependent oxidoreductase [Hamadaea sp.]NUT20600.1 FAD-dependent monooxygenase [Hamadaea sp.]
MTVLIAGGGIGGLCLAHGLRRAGVPFAVYERSLHSGAEEQGYRISLKGAGEQALRACLPPDLFALAQATALRPATVMIFMNPDLTPKSAKPIPDLREGFGVHRRTLREILLTALPGVHFGKTCTGYDADDRQVRAGFADGSSAVGDLLVGADGTNSVIRRKLLPDSAIDELGWAAYGRTPMTPDLLAQTPEELVDSFNRVIAPDGSAIAIATCRSREPIAAAVARIAPYAELTDVGEYFSWTATIPGRRPAKMDPRELHEMVLHTVRGWHPGVRRIVEAADVEATFPVAITSARPVEPWAEPRVTLLGDAIHTMSPGRGEGANVALRDAELLTDVLSSGRPWAQAKSDYERQMLEYAFGAVAASRESPFAPFARPAG